MTRKAMYYMEEADNGFVVFSSSAGDRTGYRIASTFQLALMALADMENEYQAKRAVKALEKDGGE